MSLSLNVPNTNLHLTTDVLIGVFYYSLRMKLHLTSQIVIDH